MVAGRTLLTSTRTEQLDLRCGLTELRERRVELRPSAVTAPADVTVSPPDAEIGISANTGWKPYPAPVPGSRADGSMPISASGGLTVT
jgi:hypothetical protein